MDDLRDYNLSYPGGEMLLDGINFSFCDDIEPVDVTGNVSSESCSTV